MAANPTPTPGEAPHCGKCPWILKVLESCPAYFWTPHLQGHTSIDEDYGLYAKDAFMTFVSAFPYFLGALLLLNSAISRKKVFLFEAALLVAQWVISKVFKKIVKESRPPGNCSSKKSYGMPSQHCSFTTTLIVWLYLSNFYTVGKLCLNQPERVSLSRLST